LPCANQASVNLTLRGSATAGSGGKAALTAAVLARKPRRDILRRIVI
jgi:hypothetical protein